MWYELRSWSGADDPMVNRKLWAVRWRVVCLTAQRLMAVLPTVYWFCWRRRKVRSSLLSLLVFNAWSLVFFLYQQPGVPRVTFASIEHYGNSGDSYSPSMASPLMMLQFLIVFRLDVAAVVVSNPVQTLLSLLQSWCTFLLFSCSIAGSSSFISTCSSHQTLGGLVVTCCGGAWHLLLRVDGVCKDVCAPWKPGLTGYNAFRDASSLKSEKTMYRRVCGWPVYLWTEGTVPPLCIMSPTTSCLHHQGRWPNWRQ